jgi:hypothetical protein
MESLFSVTEHGIVTPHNNQLITSWSETHGALPGVITVMSVLPKTQLHHQTVSARSTIKSSSPQSLNPDLKRVINFLI